MPEEEIPFILKKNLKPKAISKTSMLQIVLLGEIVIARDRHRELFIDLKRLQRTDSFLPPSNASTPL